METPTPTPQTSPAPPKSVNGTPKDARLWATFAHLSAVLGILGVPMGNIIGPLVIWLVKKDEHPFIDDQGREALNFQISMLIYTLVGLAASVILFFTMILAPLGILFILGLYIFEIIQIILASIKANEGVAYRYPLSIRMIQ